LGHLFRSDTTELAVGPALAQFFATTPETLEGRRWREAVAPDERSGLQAHLDSFTPSQPFGVYETTVFDGADQRRCLRWYTHAVFDAHGRFEHFEAVATDLTEQERLAKRLTAEKAVARAILETLPDLFYMYNAQNVFLRWNRKLEEVSGYTSEEIPRMHPLDFIADTDKPQVRNAMQRVFEIGEAEVDADLVTRSGQRLPHLFKGRRTTIDGETVINGFAVDISERKRLEDKIKHQATHDHLTGLWNRVAFEETLRKEINRTARSASTFSLIMLDIDRFKAINDHHGHAVGDRVLQQLGELLQSRFRQSDIVARWGGEEFIALLPETRFDGARKLAEDIRKSVEAADFQDLGPLTVSLGAVQYRAGEARREVTKRADDALYAAKHAGRNRVMAK